MTGLGKPGTSLPTRHIVEEEMMRPSQLSLYHDLGKQRALQRKFISKNRLHHAEIWN